MTITELSIKRPLLITVIFATLILFGYLSYNTLNYNTLPKFDVNVISIQTVYKGASSNEVQTSVTKPIEEAVSAIEGVDVLSSSSREGLSLVTVTLKAGTNNITAQNDAERKINQIKSNLPTDADDPVVNRFSTDEMPILRLSITSKIPQTELFEFVDLKVKPMLTNVAGVAQVKIIGGVEREILIALDNDKLRGYTISATQVNQIISGSGLSFPAGNIKSDKNRFSIRMDAKIFDVEQLRNIIIRENSDGSRILLRDIASVSDFSTEPTLLNRINGKQGIGIEILKQSDANAVKVSEEVKNRLVDIKKLYAATDFDYKIATDQSTYTLASAEGVKHDLFLAVMIVAFVMIMFLHSVRSSLFVLIAIPSAMIPTFILMWVFGFSLNLMTLMALSLVVGILVDDSIVVLENIYRHLEMGKNKHNASLDGRNEISFTAIAITLVDVVVFLPLSLAGGLIGNILKEFSLVIVFSTLMSLLVSFTLTPLLTSKWGKVALLNPNTLWGKLNIGFENAINSLKEIYGEVLVWSLNHKRYIIGGVFVVLTGTLALIPAGFVGTSFIGTSDRGEFLVQIDMASETPLIQTNAVVKRVEAIILNHPEVINVFSNVGTQTGAGGSTIGANSNLAELTVSLVDHNERTVSTDEFGQKLRDEISKIPGVKITILPTSITGNSQSPIIISVKGSDVNDVLRAAACVKDVVSKTPGTDYVKYSTKSAKTEISIDIDREKLSNAGLSIPEVGQAVQLAFQGNNHTKFKDAGEEYGINIMLDNWDKHTNENVKNLAIMNRNGAVIQLSEIANVNEIMGQAVLERTNRLNSVNITSEAIGRPTGTIVEDIKQKLTLVELPEGVTIDYEGDTKNQVESFSSLALAMAIGILLVYLIMVALYESVVYPFVVLFSIPVAMIGAILALALTLNSLTIFAILGLIMLLGLVSKNAILIVDFTNHLVQSGMTVKKALVEAGKERLRPIMMTTFAMIFGMLPIALASGAGAEVKNGMAWVIIGGLSSSMIFTLVLVPSVYLLIENWKNNVQRFLEKQKIQTVTKPIQPIES
ncbi:MAG: efflux RND transporter permease subunit [Bacteroidales bacterium]|nr:efflux RND transporter permease subunit [Bacteroidales bacterium]